MERCLTTGLSHTSVSKAALDRKTYYAGTVSNSTICTFVSRLTVIFDHFLNLTKDSVHQAGCRMPLLAVRLESCC